MVPPPDPWPDWRRERDYLHLLRADRSAFAWEWLRRDETYRAEWAGRGGRADASGARRWGLHAYVDPSLPVPLARPLWRREVFPFVLEVEAEEAGGDADRFDIGRLASLATVVKSRGGEEHLLLSDGLRGIRLDVREGSICGGPVRLRYRLAGLAAVEAPLLVLRRLVALWRRGRFSQTLHAGEVRARRWIAMLRAQDGLAGGATQRELAQMLVGGDASLDRWRVAAPTVRSRVQRLAHGARRMRGSGYLSLLGSAGGDR